MAANPIAVPSVKGVKGAVTDYGLGAAGGLVFGLSRMILGSGFLGSLIAAAVAGSAIKGTRGETIATVSGYMAMADLFGGAGASAAPARTNRPEVM